MDDPGLCNEQLYFLHDSFLNESGLLVAPESQALVNRLPLFEAEYFKFPAIFGGFFEPVNRAGYHRVELGVHAHGVGT